MVVRTQARKPTSPCHRQRDDVSLLDRRKCLDFTVRTEHLQGGAESDFSPDIYLHTQTQCGLSVQ